MDRACVATVVGLWIASLAACVAPDEPTTGASAEPLEGSCDYITCGRNTSVVGNAFVDQVYFDSSPNERGQQFLGWVSASGEPIAPHLTSRSLFGNIDGHLYTGKDLVGSVITMFDRRFVSAPLLSLRFTDARSVTLPNGLTTWVYRIDVWSQAQGSHPLCPLFDHTSDEIARYALIGTREVLHASDRRVTAHAPSEGRLTLGCPSSAAGKLLSLGALTTTAATTQQPVLDEMNAALLALTLSPTRDRSYTQSGIGILFNVMRTGVDNNDESLAGGFEGAWGRDGAICLDQLRIADEAKRLALWSETHVPLCSQVDLHAADVLVKTYVFLGNYPAYPPRSPLPVIRGAD